jgi:hypothetical protein
LYLVPIFLLIIAGSWHAWRHNPSYSTRTTLKYLGAAAVMVAAVLGASVVIFSHTQQSSPGLGVVLMMIMVFFGVAGFTMTVIRINTGAATHLPPSVPIGDTHRRRVRRWAERAGLALLFLLASAAMAPAGREQGLLVMGGFALFLGAIILFPLYYQARLFDRNLAALESNPWIHWQYTHEQWGEWIEAQVARLQTVSPVIDWKRGWRIFLMVIAISGGVAGLYGNGWQGILGFMCLIATLLLFGIWLASWFARRAPDVIRRRLAAATPEAYFGPDGLYCEGNYMPWILSGNYLTGVQVDERAPRSLTFRFNKVAGYRTLQVEWSTPIPIDAGRDIALLYQRLSEQCPKASIQMVA